MPTQAPLDPTTYASSSAGAYTLGQVIDHLGAQYRFVFFSLGAVDGDVMVWYSSGASSYQVIGANRATALAGTPAGTACAGVAVRTMATNDYGFVLVRGRHTNVTGVATVTLQAMQMASTTNDSGVDWTGAAKPFGVALTTLSGGRYTVEVAV